LIPEAKEFREAGAPDGPRELAKMLHPPFVVEPGDVLLVTAGDLDSPVRIPADQPVQPDGTIDLGKYGRPVVAGRTVPEIEAEVQRRVKEAEKGAGGAVQVRILNRNSKVYYVLGEVNAPGAFPITGRETALDGIVAAGGLTRRASEGRIIISRPSPPNGCRTVLPVCYPQIVQLGDTTTNYQLQPGDRIYVPSRTLWEDLNPCPPKPTCSCSGPQVPCNRCDPVTYPPGS
jgi:protein involved in polysaccharide export with SLBB domain